LTAFPAGDEQQSQRRVDLVFGELLAVFLGGDERRDEAVARLARRRSMSRVN